MHEILRKEVLNPTVQRLDILAPEVARKARPGQFIILIPKILGERIPLTIADVNPATGAVTIIFQIVGATTEILAHMRPGEHLEAFVGPLGLPTHIDGVKKAAVVGGGVGCAIAFPVAKGLHAAGADVTAITGFRGQDLVILEHAFGAHSSRHVKVSDDGTWGRKGLVTDALKSLLESVETFDRDYAIGPLIMMKYVVQLTRGWHLPTLVSMNPIMIDGTGMCGCCRLTVGGETKFACVDGPDFDGFDVDFDEAISRCAAYRDMERADHARVCNLLKQGDVNHG
jgi:ferredoxin--NADP+ reductase